MRRTLEDVPDSGDLAIVDDELALLGIVAKRYGRPSTLEIDVGHTDARTDNL